MGSFVGGAVLGLGIMSLMRWLLAQVGYRNAIGRLVIPAVVFLTIATLAGAFGYARSGEGPQFLLAFQRYVLPAIVVTILLAILDHRARLRQHDAGDGDGSQTGS